MRPVALIAVALLSGCSDTPDAPDENLISLTDISAEPTAVPPPNYDDMDGDKYFYVSVVSEEDKKKGKAVGEVSAFRYLGEKDGMYRLEFISEGGRRVATAECKRPCKVTKTIWVDGRVTRGGYNPGSILGAAFEDAFNGHLVVSAVVRESSELTSSRKTDVRSVPATFVGEWNENLADCGTDRNDTRLRIEPAQLLFYESRAQVEDVVLHDVRTITVRGSFSGEGESWTDTYRMALSPSGSELVTGDLTRKRCI